MVHGRTLNISGQFKTTLFIKEGEDQLANLGQNPVIEVGSGMLEYRSVILVFLALKNVELNNKSYVSFFDYYHEEGRYYFSDLSHQDKIQLMFVSDNGVERVLEINSHLKEAFNSYTAFLENESYEWNREEFLRMRSEFCNSYDNNEIWSLMKRDIKKLSN